MSVLSTLNRSQTISRSIMGLTTAAFTMGMVATTATAANTDVKSNVAPITTAKKAIKHSPRRADDATRWCTAYNNPQGSLKQVTLAQAEKIKEYGSICFSQAQAGRKNISISGDNIVVANARLGGVGAYFKAPSGYSTSDQTVTLKDQFTIGANPWWIEGLGIVVGAGIGAGIGAALPSHYTTYQTVPGAIVQTTVPYTISTTENYQVPVVTTEYKAVVTTKEVDTTVTKTYERLVKNVSYVPVTPNGFSETKLDKALCACEGSTFLKGINSVPTGTKYYGANGTGITLGVEGGTGNGETMSAAYAMKNAKGNILFYNANGTLSPINSTINGYLDGKGTQGIGPIFTVKNVNSLTNGMIAVGSTGIDQFKNVTADGQWHTVVATLSYNNATGTDQNTGVFKARIVNGVLQIQGTKDTSLSNVAQMDNTSLKNLEKVASLTFDGSSMSSKKWGMQSTSPDTGSSKMWSGKTAMNWKAVDDWKKDKGVQNMASGMKGWNKVDFDMKGWNKAASDMKGWNKGGSDMKGWSSMPKGHDHEGEKRVVSYSEKQFTKTFTKKSEVTSTTYVPVQVTHLTTAQRQVLTIGYQTSSVQGPSTTVAVPHSKSNVVGGALIGMGVGGAVAFVVPLHGEKAHVDVQNADRTASVPVAYFKAPQYNR